MSKYDIAFGLSMAGMFISMIGVALALLGYTLTTFVIVGLSLALYAVAIFIVTRPDKDQP